MKSNQYLLLFTVVAFLALFISGCGTVHVDEGISAQELWDISKDHFEREKYLDAVDLLTTFTLNHSGSTLIDSAQFLLAECHFILKEYIIAEAEYGRLIQNFPQSPLIDDAWMKVVLCFFYLSPKADLDQRHTERTVAAINDFQDEYPQFELQLRLAVKPTGWQAFRRVMTLGFWKPPRTAVRDISLYRTKVVYPQRGINFGQWLLRVFTFGFYNPVNTNFKIPHSEIVDGNWVVKQAYVEARSRLAQKTFHSGELYYRLKKYPSAIIYYDTVIEQYDETPWVPFAIKNKGDAYFAMHKYDKAIQAYNQYLEKYDPADRDKITRRIEECIALASAKNADTDEFDIEE